MTYSCAEDQVGSVRRHQETEGTSVRSSLLTRLQMVRGPIRINQKNFQDSFIPAPEGFARDIYIPGLVARNRALEGDIVVVELYPKEQWRILEQEARQAGYLNPSESTSLRVDMRSLPYEISTRDIEKLFQGLSLHEKVLTTSDHSFVLNSCVVDSN